MSCCNPKRAGDSVVHGSENVGFSSEVLDNSGKSSPSSTDSSGTETGGNPGGVTKGRGNSLQSVHRSGSVRGFFSKKDNPDDADDEAFNGRSVWHDKTALSSTNASRPVRGRSSSVRSLLSRNSMRKNSRAEKFAMLEDDSSIEDTDNVDAAPSRAEDRDARKRGKTSESKKTSRNSSVDGTRRPQRMSSMKRQKEPANDTSAEMTTADASESKQKQRDPRGSSRSKSRRKTSDRTLLTEQRCEASIDVPIATGMEGVSRDRTLPAEKRRTPQRTSSIQSLEERVNDTDWDKAETNLPIQHGSRGSREFSRSRPRRVSSFRGVLSQQNTDQSCDLKAFQSNEDRDDETCNRTLSSKNRSAVASSSVSLSNSRGRPRRANSVRSLLSQEYGEPNVDVAAEVVQGNEDKDEGKRTRPSLARNRSGSGLRVFRTNSRGSLGSLFSQEEGFERLSDDESEDEEPQTRIAVSFSGSGSLRGLFSTPGLAGSMRSIFSKQSSDFLTLEEDDESTSAMEATPTDQKPKADHGKQALGNLSIAQTGEYEKSKLTVASSTSKSAISAAKFDDSTLMSTVKSEKKPSFMKRIRKKDGPVVTRSLVVAKDIPVRWVARQDSTHLELNFETKFVGDTLDTVLG